MNTIRNFFPNEIEELKIILQTVYKRIYEYQNDRTEKKEKIMCEAIQKTMPLLMLFKKHIPSYKQKYIELLENQEQLKAFDLIICFDRAIYELHARVQAGEFAHLPWSKDLRDLLNERQLTTEYEGTANNFDTAFITSGMGVSQGTIEGPACLVLDGESLSKVKKGDILVTPMTDPGFISVAHIISGVITDRGGIVCHAAILAREFNIPCIVGCKNASEQITDGDWIQMDSSTGIVMRIYK